MERLYYLDAMRSILMMLGIVLHAAVIFGNNSWLLTQSETSTSYNSIIDFIHLFRMPAFFIVSGFFCHMTLNRYGSRIFLKIRTPRIFIPLFVTAISLNSIQNWFLADYRSLDTVLFSTTYWLQGIWVSHLWFLVTLLYYFIFSATCFLLFRNIIDKALKLASWIYLKSDIFSLLLLSLASLILIKASYLINWFIPESQFDWLLGDSISYAIYFFFGYLAGQYRKVLDRFTQFSIRVLAINTTLLIITYLVIDSLPTPLINTAKLLLSSLSSWLLCYLCFIAFKTLANSPSKFFSYFSEASYSIYLFHHLLVIVYATLVYQLSIPYWLMYFMLMLITFVSTVLIHHFIIRKYSMFKYLFNGKH